MFEGIWRIMKWNRIRNRCLLLMLFSPFVMAARPLTILFVVGHFPAPSQTFILNQMTRLIERGHRVLIYAFHYHANIDIHPDILKYGLLDCIVYDYSLDNLPECDVVLCQFGYLGKKVVESSYLAQWLQGKKVVTCLRGADITSRV